MTKKHLARQFVGVVGKGGNIASWQLCQPGEAIGPHKKKTSVQWRADHLHHFNVEEVKSLKVQGTLVM